MAFICCCLIFSQSERPYVHSFSLRMRFPAPRLQILTSKLCTRYVHIYIHTHVLLWGVRCASVGMTSLYSIVYTDGSLSATPAPWWPQVWYGNNSYVRAEQAVTRGFETGNGGEVPEQILLTRPPWRNWQSPVTLCRSKWRSLGANTL